MLLHRRDVIRGLGGLVLARSVLGRSREVLAAGKLKPAASHALIVVDVQNWALHQV